MTSPPRRRVDFPTPGEPLVVENIGWEFHQRGAEWLSFRPDIAAALAWTPEPGTGRAAGTPHEATWPSRASGGWTDGGGQADMGMDDTAAEGHAVILTAAGFTDASTAISEITTHFELTRDAQDDRDGTVSVTATRIHNLRASTRGHAIGLDEAERAPRLRAWKTAGSAGNGKNDRMERTKKTNGSPTTDLHRARDTG